MEAFQAAMDRARASMPPFPPRTPYVAFDRVAASHTAPLGMSSFGMPPHNKPSVGARLRMLTGSSFVDVDPVVPMVVKPAPATKEEPVSKPVVGAEPIIIKAELATETAAQVPTTAATAPAHVASCHVSPVPAPLPLPLPPLPVAAVAAALAKPAPVLNVSAGGAVVTAVGTGPAEDAWLVHPHPLTLAKGRLPYSALCKWCGLGVGSVVGGVGKHEVWQCEACVFRLCGTCAAQHGSSALFAYTAITAARHVVVAGGSHAWEYRVTWSNGNTSWEPASSFGADAAAAARCAELRDEVAARRAVACAVCAGSGSGSGSGGGAGAGASAGASGVGVGLAGAKRRAPPDAAARPARRMTAFFSAPE